MPHGNDGRGVLSAMIPPETYDLPPSMKARRWQDEASAEFRKKMRLHHGGYFTFLLNAGVGSGKTIWAALTAAYLLNRKDVDRVVLVCPSRQIRRRVVEEFAKVGIDLRIWTKAILARGEPPQCRGVVITYQALINHHEAQARLCAESRTLVIFDEVHHLGDNLSWGEVAKKAFEHKAACVLCLSGTPFRGDNRAIPFVDFEPEVNGLRTYRADFTYSLGRSISEGVCKMPVFHWLGGNVKIKHPDQGKVVVDFDTPLPIPLMGRRLNGAVRHGSASRARALGIVTEFCRRTGRKLIIFVGGDTTRANERAVRDAVEYLPAELRAHGVMDREMCAVVAEDPLAHDKIAAFGASDAWVLIAVNLVSEGVDIPVLSAELFLTNITARATLIQRIGRALRGQGEAHIFLFSDPRNCEVALSIQDQINYEIDLGRLPREVEHAPPTGRQADAEPLAIGLNCREEGITVNGVSYAAAFRRKYEQVVRDYRYPEGHAFMSVLMPLIKEGKFGPVDDAPPTGGDAR